MPTIGPMEIAIVVIVALFIFGPKRLPALGRSIGGGMREFKDSVAGLRPGAEPGEGAGTPEEREATPAER